MKRTVPMAAALALCAGTALAAPPGAPDWVYGDGDLPEKWSITNEAYATCDVGMMQSPIDLGEANAIGEVDLATSYGEAAGTVMAGPGKVQVDVEPGMGMISGDRLFSLLQFHFHTPAEHKLDGERHPLVVHLVHGSREGRFAVLGIMFEEGDENPALDAIISGIGSDDAVTVDVAAMLPDEVEVYRYMGSLTTPPCTEGVNWHVADETVEASAAQIAAMRARLGTSNRSIQPLNNRLVVAPGD